MGTGKTTALLNLVEEELTRGTPPAEIGFLSFSRKAANEARDRACLRFGFPKTEFPWFSTLHSLAFKQLGMTKKRVLTDKRLSMVPAFKKYELTFSKFSGGYDFMGPTRGDRLLFLANLKRVRHCHSETVVRGTDISAAQLDRFAAVLNAYKEEEGLFDFTDMLDRYSRLRPGSNLVPRLRLLCLDEQQDASRMQWQAQAQLVAHSDHTVYAGDDDQAVYEWAGADPLLFLGACRDYPYRVLDQSFRVPRAIQCRANAIVARIKDRVPKEWKPRDSEGLLKHVSTLDDTPIKKGGQWLILTRHNFLIPRVAGWLKDMGVKQTTQVQVRNIHQAKGGESDNVVILPDMTKQTWQACDTPEEKRVWYVAVTRAKNSLYILAPTERRFCSL